MLNFCPDLSEQAESFVKEFKTSESTLNRYLREIGKFPVLKPEDTIQLIRKYLETKDNSIKTKLINHNLRLVVHTAFKYRVLHCNLMDLIQEGNIGLIKGIDKFDPTENVPLPVYLTYWIRAYILKFIPSNFRLVKIGTTENQRRIFYNITKARAKLESKGFSASAENLAEELKVPVQEVEEMNQRLTNVELPLINLEGETLPLASDLPGPDMILENEESVRILQKKLLWFQNHLPGTAKKQAIRCYVFQHRFLQAEPDTLEKIAADLIESGQVKKITKQRIQQIDAEIRFKLEELLAQEES